MTTLTFSNFFSDQVGQTDSTRQVVCVQGLGFVGAAMALTIASARRPDGDPQFNVIGIDLPTEQGKHAIGSLNAGIFPAPTTDAALVAAAEQAHKADNLAATSDAGAIALASVILVNVHLDITDTETGPGVRFENFTAAIEAIGDHMQAGALIIVETTIPPGTCEKVVAPILSDRLKARGLGEDDFLLAHSMERVMPGDQYLDSIINFWRVYAGHTPAAGDACGEFLSRIINVKDFPLTRLASTTASEITKIMENSYR
ncbi:MAG: nucleotide sugar dehydrogenase, partial [Rhodospirillales bacterium]|nr:nucleotide sugar dehydrogenase [Rhodospirillales bacterium]